MIKMFEWMINNIEKQVKEIIALTKQLPTIEASEQLLDIKIAELNKCYGIEKGYHEQWLRISKLQENLADWRYKQGSIEALIAKNNAIQSALAAKKYWRALKLKIKYKL